MNLLTKSLISELVGDNIVTALYGGGFKPPTKGHFEVVQKTLTEFPEIDKFIVYVGSGERNGITQAESLLIWEIYKKYLGDKVEIQPSKAPIGDIIRYGKSHPEDVVYFVIGARDGNEGDLQDVALRTSGVEDKYPNVKIKVIQTPDAGISGTKAREASKKSPEAFYKFLPPVINDNERLEIFGYIQDVVTEIVTDTEVICDNCGWEWSIADGGDDLYMCHKCGHDNSPKQLNENASYSSDINVKEKILELTKHMLAKGMNIKPLPKVKFVNGDSNNAREFLGKTAYYDPNNFTITLYTEGRHPKDIVRSFSHEMIHHIQNLENRLGDVSTTNTMEDDNIDKLEQEANLKGTMTFRNWTDSLNENIFQKSLNQTEKEALEITYKNWDKFGGKECNNGFCDIFAKNLSKYLPGSKILSTEDPRNGTLGHVWVEYEGKYFDAETPNGVSSWKDLPWMKEFYSKVRSYPTDIETLNENIKNTKKDPFGLNQYARELAKGLEEAIVGDKIECDNCGWSWDIKDGGDDLYICHKCGHDNTPKQLNETPLEVQVKKINISFELFDGTKISEDITLAMSPNSQGLFELGDNIEKYTGLTLKDAQEFNETPNDAYIYGLVNTMNNGQDIFFWTNGTRLAGQAKKLGTQTAIIEQLAHEGVHLTRAILAKSLMGDKFPTGEWPSIGEQANDTIEEEQLTTALSFVIDQISDPFIEMAKEYIPELNDQSISENLLNEGRYDSLVRQLASITLNSWKDDSKGGEKNGYFTDEITPENYPTDLNFIFKASAQFTDTKPYDHNGYSRPDGEVGVKYIIPKDMVPQGWGEIYMDLISTIRHEIEHQTQSGKNVKAGKGMESDATLRKLIKTGGDVVRYVTLPKEVDANVNGLYLKAKKWKRPYAEVVDEYIKDFIGIDNPADASYIKNIFAKRAKELNLPNILTEGRYDKSTNEFSNIVFDMFKSIHDRGDKKGEFEFSVGPDDEDIYSKEFEFDLAGVVEITDDEYEVDGGANAGFDTKGEEVTPLLSVRFKIPKNPDWQRVSFDIKDVIRHELEHLTQDGLNVRPGKQMSDDQMFRDMIDMDLLPKADYFKLEKEIDAMLQGLYLKAKKSRRPYKEVIDNYLSTQPITANDKEEILNLWRRRGKVLSLPLFEARYKLKQVMKEEEIKQTYQIYCDMDGVLVDFDKQFEKASGGVPPSEYEEKNGKEAFWNLIDNEKGVGFWVGMPWMPNGKQLWEHIKPNNPILLSSPSRSNSSRLGKRLWVRNNLPNTKLILANSYNKKNYADGNNILIDDRPSNIDQWNAAGGIGILFISTSQTIEELKKYGL